MDRLQHLEPSVSGGDDVIGVGAPDKRLGFGDVVFGDEAVDGGLQVDDRMEHAVLESAPRQFGKEPLDRIQPGRRCRDEVERPARMPGQPGAHLGMFVGAVVVEDDVDGLALGDVAFDPVEEADEFLMPVALHVLPYDRSVQHVERGKERGRAVAFVIVGHGRPAPLL